MSMSKQAAGPDVCQLEAQGLAEVPFAGRGQQSFRVYLAPEVHAGIWQHASENSSVEICGVLVGRWGKDAAGPHVQANAFIRGEAASSKFAEVTFTHETWSRINEQMDTRYADQSVVGWYHSHPDFGIFLSDRDRFIQEHFFSGPGQVAYVVDPVRKTEGIFVWNKGKPTLAPYHWVGDRLQVSTSAEESRPAVAPHEEKPAPVSGAPALVPTGAIAWIDALMRVASYACIFLLGLVLAGYLTRSLNDYERLRIEQAARIQALLYVNYRPGLGEELDLVDKDLSSVMLSIGALAKQHPELLDKAKESRDQLTDAARNLTMAAERVVRARSLYCLSPEENVQLMKLLGGKAGVGKDKSDTTHSKEENGKKSKDGPPPAGSK